MNRPRWSIDTMASLLILGVSASTLDAAALDPQDTPRASAPAPNHLLLQISREAFESGGFRIDLGATGRTGLLAVDARLAELGAVEAKPVFRTEVNSAAKRRLGMDRVFLVRYEHPVPVADAVARLRTTEGVAFAEPRHATRIAFVPDDPMYPEQWAHDNRAQAHSWNGQHVGTLDGDIDSDRAWDLERGAVSIAVAILDTGIDLGHPEFAGRLLPGWDFANNDADPTDDHGHGTACAGIAAARGNNGEGVAGVAWNVEILPVKVLDETGHGWDDDVAAGIEFAVDAGADVISMSLGSYNYSETEAMAVEYAHSEGVAMFAATGNDDVSQIEYPALYGPVIAVGSMSPCKERKSPGSCDEESWWGSNYGIDIDFVAPGVRIPTTDCRGAAGFDVGDYFDHFNGTSSATPCAAGIGALMLSWNPGLTPWVLRSILQNTCNDIGDPGYDLETGYGCPNAYAAVAVSGATVVWVDFGYTGGPENGSYETPYNTLTEGMAALPGEDPIIAFKTGSTSETRTISQPVVLHATGRGAILGQP